MLYRGSLIGTDVIKSDKGVRLLEKDWYTHTREL